MPPTILKLRQTGEAVLRQPARSLGLEEIISPEIQRLIVAMRDTLRRAWSGWISRGVEGSPHVYTHPVKPGHISVPHPRKDLGIGLANKLMKQAGLK